MTTALRKSAQLVCLIAGIILGAWGLLLALAIVNEVAGFWGLFVGLTILPVTFAAAPLYAALAWGNWFPLLICYGGGIAAGTLVAIGLAKD